MVVTALDLIVEGEMLMSEAVTANLKARNHILPTASTMIGVSTTLIGLVKIVEARIGPSHVDEYAGCAAVLFMLSAINSYLSGRFESRVKVSDVLEHIADGLFVVGLLLISCIALFFAYELI